MWIGDFGQPRIETQLDEMLTRGRVGGSFLFDGPPGVGKEALAVEIGRVLNCERAVDGGTPCPARAPFTRLDAAPPRAAKAKAAAGPAAKRAATLDVPMGADRCGSCHKFDLLQHPDLLLVFPVPTDTWDEAVPQSRGDQKQYNTLGEILRQKAANPYYRKDDFDRPSNIEAEVLRDKVLPMAYSRPVEGRIKTIIISDAEQMARGIGNVLLKTLEEPPANCLLVLTTTVPQRLLPTILSRCQRLRFSPLAPEWMQPRLQALHDVLPDKARLAAAVSQGSMLAAQRFLDGGLQELRDSAIEILQWAAADRELELLERAQSMAQEHGKKRHAVPLLLQLMLVAGRDALVAGAGGTKAGRPAPAAALINSDRAADIAEIARAFTPEALRQVLRDAGTAERQIAHNAAVEHTLAAFFLDVAQAARQNAAPVAGPARRR